jgi:hypothetical protein
MRQSRTQIRLAGIAVVGCWCTSISLLVLGCGHSPSGGGFLATTTTPGSVTSGTTTPPKVTPLAAPAVYPLILVHGIAGDPSDFAVFESLMGEGRVVVPELYAFEADQLKAGTLPASCIVGAGYYKERTTDPKYLPDANGVSHGSIGGSPLPRTDPWATSYTQSYVERLSRIVEGVRRATGSDRVDLVLHSQGNIVGRGYTRWRSSGARSGGSKVHDIFMIAGPQRGLNAVEAYSVGWDRTPDIAFMRQGEIAEMCQEYDVWSGQSYVDQLNDGWDAFCAQNDVSYAGLSGAGAHGTQVDPQGNIVVNTIAVIVGNIVGALINQTTIADLKPFYDIFWPKLIPEAADALETSDGVVRLALSRLDGPPFGRTYLWAPLETRHTGTWNPEQATTGSTVTSELARTFFGRSLGAVAQVATFDAVLVDAPGKASWIALESTVSADTMGAQLIEETLDTSGNPVGGAVGYGCRVLSGTQRVFFQVPATGGARRYHAVLYSAYGSIATRDVTVHLTAGTQDTPPVTTFVGATSKPVDGWPAVQATFASNAGPQDKTLGFSYRLDGGVWSAFTQSPSFTTPPLGPGEHRLEVRSQHSTNGAALLCQDERGVAIGLAVDARGGFQVRH